MNRKTYIIAVSGGVDSVVLLHKLMSVKPPNITYVVAHFDHGIRPDSAEDAAFVEKLAISYKTTFALERAELGQQASEDEARVKRYAFLRSAAHAHKAEAIITAHHQDDIIETMIVNFLRGTGPRGLVGYTSTDILRPFMNKTKKELVAYAKQHKLEWREDITNTDDRYLRNYVRNNLTKKLSNEDAEKLLAIRAHLQDLYGEIDNLIKRLLVQTMKKGELYRPLFVVLPYSVQKELIATLLRLEQVSFDKKMIEKAVITVKTLEPDRQVVLKKNVTLYTKKHSVLIKVDSNSV